MQESRKRKSTVPMGVFSQTADPSLDQPIERQEVVDQGSDGIESDAKEKRAMLDRSPNQSKSEHAMTDSSTQEKGDATLLEQDNPISDIGSDENVEELKAEKPHDPSIDLASATVLRDSRPRVKDGDPLKAIADKMDRFAVRVSNSLAEGEERNPGFDRSDARSEKRQSTDVAADLGNAMKALFDNRRESEWEDFVRESDEAGTTDQREAKRSSASDQAVEVESAESTLTPESVENPAAKSATAQPLIHVDPPDIRPISSLAPLETKNTPSPRTPLVGSGVAGAATAIVLLVAVTWTVIESRGNQPAIGQSDSSESPAKSKVQAKVLSSVAPLVSRPNTQHEHRSDGLADSKNVEQKTVRPIKSKAKRLSRRSTRTVRTNRRNEPQTESEPAPTTESASSAESEPADALQQPIEQLEALPQIPSRKAIFTSLSSLRSQVRQCLENKTGVAELDIRIKSSGRVSHVVVYGDFRGTKQGSCIARIVRKARFEPFKQPEFRVLFPYAF